MTKIEDGNSILPRCRCKEIASEFYSFGKTSHLTFNIPYTSIEKKRAEKRPHNIPLGSSCSHTASLATSLSFIVSSSFAESAKKRTESSFSAAKGSPFYY